MKTRLCVGLLLSAWNWGFAAEGDPGRIEVYNLLGSATITPASGTPGPAKIGSVLSPGAVIKTGPGAAVDLYLANRAGVLRLVANTTVTVEKYTVGRSEEGALIDLQIELQEGSVLGSGNKITSGSKYQVKVANGITGIVNGEFRINSQGYLVLLNGKLVHVHVPTTGDPTAHTLTSPPAVYFSPTEGVKEAPSALVREVNNQLNTKIGNR